MWPVIVACGLSWQYIVFMLGSDTAAATSTTGLRLFFCAPMMVVIPTSRFGR